MYAYIDQIKKINKMLTRIKREEDDPGQVKSKRKHEIVRVVKGSPRDPRWVELCAKRNVDHHLYAIEYTRGLEQPPTYIGVYLTKNSARRVSNLMKKYDSVLEYVLQYATDTTDFTEHVALCAEKDLSLNFPIGKPKEYVRYVSSKRQVKISTPDHQGYFLDRTSNGTEAYKHKAAILASGNLNAYIDSEKPAVDV
jgi:hypothetical protein